MTDSKECGNCRFAEPITSQTMYRCDGVASLQYGYMMLPHDTCGVWVGKDRDLPRAPLAEYGPWPDVVQFLTADGVMHPVPPLDGRAYRVIVAPGRLADYEELARSGRLYSLYDRQDLQQNETWVPQAWRLILGLPAAPSVVDEKDIGRAYRKMARLHHPDIGGSHEGMLVLVAAYEAALRDVGYTPQGE